MQNKNLPVRVNAVMALNTLIEAPEIKEAMVGDLHIILTSILKLMNEIDLDHLVKALKEITVEFGDKISPYAVDLVKSLAESFVKYKQNAYKNSKDNQANLLLMDEDSSESNLAAEMCLDAINNILRIDLPEEVYAGVGPTIIGLFDMALLSNSPNCLEKSLSFVNIVIYKYKGALPSDLVFYFPLLCYLISGFPHADQLGSLGDRVTERQLELLKRLPPQQYPIFNAAYLLSPIMNFMQRFGEEKNFVSSQDAFGVSFTDVLFKSIQVLGDNAFKSNNNIDLFLSIRLMMGFMENFRDQIDSFIPNVLEILIEVLRTERAPHLKGILVGAFSIAILYNPKSFISFWESKGHEAKVQFFSWYQNAIPELESDIDKERALYGLGALLSLADESLLDGLNPTKLLNDCVCLSSHINNIKRDELQKIEQKIEEQTGHEMEDPNVKESYKGGEEDVGSDGEDEEEDNDEDYVDEEDDDDEIDDEDFSGEHVVGLLSSG